MFDYREDGTPTPTTVQIADIVLRKDWQVRAGLNDRVIRDYVTATIHGRMPPIRLARVNGALMLVDGWHRLAAAKKLERSTIMAIVEDMTEQDARWAAADANTTHGLPLRHAEKRKVFRGYVQTEHHKEKRRFKSYREIARELHGIVGKSTLQRWMEADFPEVAAKMSSGRSAEGALPEVNKHTIPYLHAVAHLEQIVATAPALSEDERRLLADQLTDAASKVPTVGPWEPPDDEL
jgi:ParB-like nuclease domain